MADAPHPIQIEEVWLEEWVFFGLLDLERYLERWAVFQRYLDDNDRKEAA